ncbi:LysR family transcriptional regulator [Caballeronia sp. Lep1P3]|uniref:LysR family transcriptional regulator n=1 Tax=Caballeronia sp. Lep1P3 TaxID=2878150 RepID=UPI001FD2EA89|nr:LysR family transcriptional regulator [Caballeronia sp. Lep1P3]
MEMLVIAVDEGSLSAPARQLKTPVSTLTRKVADVEALLGTRLLIQTTRKLTLTDTGTAYVAAARRMLATVREQEHEATGEFATARGERVVAAPVQLGRLHVLRSSISSWPNVRTSQCGCFSLAQTSTSSIRTPIPPCVSASCRTAI